MTEVDESQALVAVTQTLLAPLARLLVARGVPFAAAEESLKVAMIEAAREAHPDGLPHRLVSRISTTTGINRREVTRLTRSGARPATAPHWTVSQLVFTRWRSVAEYLDANGQPRALPRQGEAPSFESLARSVTQDVHPRSLLDELLRLGLATHDLERDSVSLAPAEFVPSADQARMLDFLANNCGDHLCAAVDNVIGANPRHLERAVFAHGLSADSVATAQAWVAQAWLRMHAELVPLLEGLIAQDDADPTRETNRRFRAGLFAYTERDKAAEPAPEPAKKTTGSAAARAAKPRSRKAGNP